MGITPFARHANSAGSHYNDPLQTKMTMLWQPGCIRAGSLLLKPIASIPALLLFAGSLACDSRPAPDGSPEPASSQTTSGRPAHPRSSAPASLGAVPAQYAGSESCAECHEDAYEEWKTSHHADAQRDFLPELDWEAFVPRRTIHHGTQTSFAEFKDGRYAVITTGSDGQQHRYEPIGVIGVDPLRQYFIPQSGERLQVTELAYDPAEAEWFDVYGDEDRRHWEWGHWSRRGMNWNSMCATCHTTAFQKNYDPITDSYDSRYFEQGVGCEQCHGPMQVHVDWQEAHPDERTRSEETGERLDPTLDDFEFDRDDYLNICATCHARRSDLTGNFQPGDDFLEHYEPVLPDLTDTFYPDGQIWDEDFEYTAFTLSYMYAWGVRCMDCHYWHSGEVATKENALCLRCHEHGISTKRPIDAADHSQHPPDKDGFKCTDCHMPQTVYMARHWRHDHGMTIPDPLLTREHGIPNACTRCHKEEGVDWAIDYVEKWYGGLMDRPTRTRARLLARLKAGDFQAAGPLLALLRQEKSPAWRAVYLKFLQAVGSSRDEQTVGPVIEQMSACLDDPSPLVQAAVIEALEPLARAVAGRLSAKLDSPHRPVRIKSAWALRQRVDMRSPAGRDLVASLECKQDQPLGAFQWASLYADTGRATESLAWYEKAIRWDRRLVPARHGYAATLHALGRSYDAVNVLVEGSEVEPDNPLYPYWLGLLYNEMGEATAARDALRAAVARDETQARFWYNLALAEARLEQIDAALKALDRAEKLQPDEPHYPYTRASIHYDLQQYDLAREALERALEINPDYELALGLLREM